MSGRYRNEFELSEEGTGWFLDETLPVGSGHAKAHHGAHHHDDGHEHADGWFTLLAGLSGHDHGTHAHEDGHGHAHDAPTVPAWLFGGRQKLSDSLGVTKASDAPSGTALASIQGDYAYGDGDPGTTETIHYAFGSGRFTEGGKTYHGLAWSDEKMAQFRVALASWQAVANIRFVEVDDPADADIVEYLLDSSDLGQYTLGYHYGPFEGPSIGAYNVDYWNLSGGKVADPGGYFFTTLVHEIGHALGLGHPHDTSLGSSIMDGVSEPFGDFGTANLNQGVYSVMSYNKGFEQQNGWLPTDAIHAGTKGPSALDIAAIQNLYGPNQNFASGNNVYRLPDDNVAGTGYKTIWDTGGIDAIVYSGSRDVVIDLRDASLAYNNGGGGFLSSAAGVEGGFTIAAGVVIENIRAGSGDDRLIGNAADNVIKGGPGNDTIFGLGGHDILIGGQGDDIVKGGHGNDRLSGGPGDDRLFGGPGNDVLIGGRGNDILVGGPGRDRFVFVTNNGKDVIKDFEGGLDRLDFRRVDGVDSLDDLTIREYGGGTLILFNGHRVALQGFDIADLDAGDFIF